MTLAIETSGLTKTYGSVRAVIDLDLKVESGEILAFLGPNGAGKSTTIRMLLALQQPTAGRACLLGLDSHADRVQIHRRIGYLPGDLELYPRMTGRHMIDWFAHARGGADRAAIDRLCDRFQVVTERRIRELSKGNRQKIGIVLAFMTRPELLVLDEPTVGLDPLMQNEFETLIHETVAEGRTVFLSSHELDEVQRLADRVAIIKEGRLIVTDTVEGLRQSMPRRMEVHFRRPVAPAIFDGLTGVRIVSSDGPGSAGRAAASPDGACLVFELTGEVAPFLRVVADQDPVDLISRHADLDELFLDIYRNPSGGAENAH
jgi:ABC-2 type transport system ATP-binding protein